jgi:tRNA threonylcarbamoyladenosine modification (KEOPS) complex  Pcc1 subunit
MKAFNGEGEEIEVYSADEVTAKVAEAVTAKETEFGKTKADIEKERDDARVALGNRANEFAQFRKLSEDQVKQLGEKDRIIYENGLALQKANEERGVSEKKIYDSQVDTALRAKAGTDEKLFTKMKDMWAVIGIDAQTPEAIENKTKMILGAISTTEPDLIASVAGFTNGSWNPPQTKQNSGDGKSYADTPAGQAGAAELGLKLEPEVKK